MSEPMKTLVPLVAIQVLALAYLAVVTTATGEDSMASLVFGVAAAVVMFWRMATAAVSLRRLASERVG